MMWMGCLDLSLDGDLVEGYQYAFSPCFSLVLVKSWMSLRGEYF